MFNKYISVIAAVAEANEMIINVRRPALWRLLERSQPIMADKTTDSVIRNNTDPVFNSDAQVPSKFAM